MKKTLILTVAMVTVQIGAAQAGTPIYLKGETSIEIALRNFAALCLHEHPTATLYTVHEEGDPFPISVECLFDRTPGREARIVQGLRPSAVTCADPANTGTVTYTSCPAPAQHRQEFDPKRLDPAQQ